MRIPCFSVFLFPVLPVDDQSVLRLYEAIRDHRRFLILQPKGIDGDSIGCGLAWQHALQDMGRSVVHYAPSIVPKKYHFLEGWQQITGEFPDISQVEVTIVCDQGDIFTQGGLGERAAMLQEQTLLVDFDHHTTNAHYGSINIVVPQAASATQLLTLVFRKLGVRITPRIATPLLMGLYTDTGSFRHDNTTTDALETAAWLLGRGADAFRIAKENFQTMPLSQLRLWGRVLTRMRQNELGVTSSYIADADFEELGASPAELEGVIDYMNAVPRSPFALLMTQRGTQLKGSLRTQHNEVDVSRIAGLFGGGGHKKASGFTVNGATLRVDGEARLVETA